MQKGQQKARYKERNGKFLMSMSEDDHTRIAHLIKRWLEEDTKTR